MRIQIIDLRNSNLNSLINSIRRITKSEINVCETYKDCKSSNLTILPGNGRFGVASSLMSELGFDNFLTKTFESGNKILGICLGMQLLGKGSEESPGFTGLNLISGFSKLLPISEKSRIPNIGWAEVVSTNRDYTFKALLQNKDFYFVHSYYFDCEFTENITCKSSFGNHFFPSVIRKNNLLGVQFHPEKSSRIGHEFLSEVLNWADE